MTRPAAIQAVPTDKYAVWRTKTGTPPTADASDLTDPVYDVSAAQNLRTFDSVIIGVEADGGSPTIEIELIYHSEEGDPAWRRLLSGAGGSAITTGALAPGQEVEVNVYGHSKVFPRIVAINNPTSVTAVRILARGGKQRRLA
jgi:hypothetical protein